MIKDYNERHQAINTVITTRRKAHQSLQNPHLQGYKTKESVEFGNLISAMALRQDSQKNKEEFDRKVKEQFRQTGMFNFHPILCE